MERSDLRREIESLRQQMSDAELFDRLETRGTEISEAIERAYDRNLREARIAAVVSIVGLVLAAVALAMRLLPLMWE